MSPRIPSIAITAGLIGSGVLAWSFAGRSLLADADLKVPVNPLGINRSPYGEVFAMAMQSPIDEYFHAGMGMLHHHENGEECAECAGRRDEPNKPADACGNQKPNRNFSVNRWLNTLIAYLDGSSEIRTNPKVASDALKRHLRRQAEDKLRFAYQLDPSHYTNYNTLHFFLTEPEIGTRPELTPSAAKLAEDTIQYCFKQDNDPRPALTAAAACTNILHLMFEDSHNAVPKYNTDQMRRCLGILDQCLSRYETISKKWNESKQWELLSAQRINECEERFDFITKIRNAAEKTILRLEGKSQTQQASN